MAGSQLEKKRRATLAKVAASACFKLLRDPEGAEQLPLTQRNIIHSGGLIAGPILPAHTRGADEWR